MSDVAGGMEPRIAAQTTANIALAGRLVREALADPVMIDQIPVGASLIVLPYDDPELGVLNLGLASKRAAAGDIVRLQRVGVPPTEAPLWQASVAAEHYGGDRLPAWPRNLGNADPDIGYDPDQDLLAVDLFGNLFGDRPAATLALPINPYVLLTIDADADEVVGLLSPRFRERMETQAPRAAEYLLLTFAEIGDADQRKIDRDEVHRMRDEVGYGVRRAPLGPIVDELARLIA